MKIIECKPFSVTAQMENKQIERDVKGNKVNIVEVLTEEEEKKRKEDNVNINIDSK